MFTGIVIGRVTRDLEIQYSAEKVPYIRFNLAVNKGYGENGHTIFPQCWVFGSENVNRLMRAKVGKGSLIQIAGDIDLVEYRKKLNGVETGETGSVIKIVVWSWDYVPTGKRPAIESEENHPPIPEASLEDFEVVSDDKKRRIKKRNWHGMEEILPYRAIPLFCVYRTFQKELKAS